MARPTEAQAEVIRERRKQLVSLRLAGVDWQTIADRLGYSDKGSACKDYRRARERSQAELDMSVEELRQVELDRYDRLWVAAYPMALQGNLRAIETCLRISVERKKLLGLDEAMRVDVRTHDALDQEIAALAAELGVAVPDRVLTTSRPGPAGEDADPPGPAAD